jgi:hypothetical protein
LERAIRGRRQKIAAASAGEAARVDDVVEVEASPVEVRGRGFSGCLDLSSCAGLVSRELYGSGGATFYLEAVEILATL